MRHKQEGVRGDESLICAPFLPERIDFWCVRISATAAASNAHLGFMFYWKRSVKLVYLHNAGLTSPWHLKRGWMSRTSVSKDQETRSLHRLEIPKPELSQSSHPRTKVLTDSVNVLSETSLCIWENLNTDQHDCSYVAAMIYCTDSAAFLTSTCPIHITRGWVISEIGKHSLYFAVCCCNAWKLKQVSNDKCITWGLTCGLCGST